MDCREMLVVYIAHPLMGTTDLARELGYGDAEKNVERYLRFAAMASNDGCVVVSWVHHYLMHVRGLTTGDADYYLSRDHALIYLSQVLWVAGDPRASAGMQQEIEWAEEWGLSIVRRDRWLDAKWRP